MDLGTHLATGLVASTFFESPTAKGACIVGSILPDMVFIPHYAWRMIRKDWKFWHHMKKNGPAPHHPQWEMNAYYFVHSFIFTMVLGTGAFFLQSQVLGGFFVGYLTHILWDLPTHTGKWAQRPLYPFSSWAIHGYHNWWKHAIIRRLVVVGWFALASVYFFIS